MLRVVDSSDRRVNKIRLSKTGLEMKEKTKAVAIKAVNITLDGISEEEQRVFVDVLNRACNNIERVM